MFKFHNGEFSFKTTNGLTVEIQSAVTKGSRVKLTTENEFEYALVRVFDSAKGYVTSSFTDVNLDEYHFAMVDSNDFQQFLSKVTMPENSELVTATISSDIDYEDSYGYKKGHNKEVDQSISKYFVVETDNKGKLPQEVRMLLDNMDNACETFVRRRKMDCDMQVGFTLGKHEYKIISIDEKSSQIIWELSQTITDALKNVGASNISNTTYKQDNEDNLSEESNQDNSVLVVGEFEVHVDGSLTKEMEQILRQTAKRLNDTYNQSGIRNTGNNKIGGLQFTTNDFVCTIKTHDGDAFYFLDKVASNLVTSFEKIGARDFKGVPA